MSPSTADLDPAIWSANVGRRDGELTVAGLGVLELADTFGTPAFILDVHDLRQRANGYAAAFDGADVYYAAKAFLCTSVARWVAAEGLGIDVCTGGELAIAVQAGVDPQRIALHGNNKSTAELEQALVSGVGRIVLDSAIEIDRLAELAAAAEVAPKVLIRVTVGVEAHTHEFIATAHEDQKFGFSVSSGAAHDAVRQILRYPQLELVGVHSHIGSQIFDTSGFEVAAHRVVALLAELRDEHGIELPEIDLGGGLGIAYTSADDPQQPADIAQRLLSIIGTECKLAALTPPRLSVEPGRAIVGPAMFTLYQVGTVKVVELDGGEQRRYVSVDGGMSDNIRTALYDAEYTVTLANRVSVVEPVLSRVVGKHCESGDIVVRDCWLPGDVGVGDLLAVAATGAYCYSMASNYNKMPRPPVIAVLDSHAEPIVRRETLDDVMATDIGWLTASARLRGIGHGS